MKKTLFK